MTNGTEPLYVYDRVVPKRVKKQQIGDEYGTMYGFRPSGRARPQQNRSGPRQQNRPRPEQMRTAQRRKIEKNDSPQAARKIRRNRRARRVIGAILLIAVVSVFVLVALYKTLFVISNVKVEGTGIYDDATVTEAAGIRLGDALYSFSAGTAERSLLFRCPELSSAVVSRTIPNTVKLVLRDAEPVWQTIVWGDRIVLSSDLHVIRILVEGETCGLPMLVLPAVRSSIAGSELAFARSQNDAHVSAVLSEIEKSAIFGRIGSVDLTDFYDTVIIADGLYRMRLGGEADTDLKLRMANKVLTSQDFSTGVPARIDLSDAARAIVEFDHSLDLGGE